MSKFYQFTDADRAIQNSLRRNSRRNVVLPVALQRQIRSRLYRRQRKLREYAAQAHSINKLAGRPFANVGSRKQSSGGRGQKYWEESCVL